MLTNFRGDVIFTEPFGYGRMAIAAAWGGLRFGEVAALRESSLAGSTLRITFAVTEVAGRVELGPTKTEGSRRTINFGQEVVNILELHLEVREQWLGALRERAAKEDASVSPHVLEPDPLLFMTRYGHPLSRTRFRNRFWQPAVEFVQLKPPPTFHALRHFHAAWLIARGYQAKLIQERMGHASSRVTQDVYGHLIEGLDEAAAASLEGPAGGTYVARGSAEEGA